MGLRDIGAALPPGFRFYPSDEELVCHYLYKKITNEEVLKGTLMEIDLHTCEPWQLPEVAKLNASEWYFFSFRDRKYATGFRTNRATISGYWKATGKDRTVVDPMTREVVGMRKTLVFYRNRAPNGIKTGWIMHEFRLETPHMPPKVSFMPLFQRNLLSNEDWVLCRVFHKSKGMMPNSENSCTFESTTACASSPPSSQIMPCGYNQMMITSFASTPSHHQNENQSQSQSQNNSLLNLLQFSQDITSTNNQISSKGDDEYGFLWDMSLEENSLETVAPAPNMEEMRFEIDNNMVFL